MRRATRRQLESHGHTVVDAATALHAIDLAEHGDFDLALLDWDLGGTMSGIEVAAAIRASQAKKRMPTADKMALVIVSGHTDEEMREGWKDPLSGFMAIMPKPLDWTKLASLIDRVERSKEDTDPERRRS